MGMPLRKLQAFISLVSLKQSYPTDLIQGSQLGWPPTLVEGEKLEDNLEEMVKSKQKKHNDQLNDDILLNRIKTIIDSKRQESKFAIVFRQLFPRAQGPDVFVLVMDKTANKMILHCFRCKNTKNDEDWKSWWDSLGVSIIDTNGGHVGETRPATKNKAAYSLAGIDLLAKTIADKVGGNVVCEIGARVLVSSLEWSKLTDNHKKFVQETNDCLIFSREMLEPTISALGSILISSPSSE